MIDWLGLWQELYSIARQAKRDGGELLENEVESEV